MMKPVTFAVISLGLTGCSHLLPVFGYPPHAFRQSPPVGVDRTALAIGSVAPAVSLPATGQSNWALGDRLKGGPVVLLFYRGAW